MSSYFDKQINDSRAKSQARGLVKRFSHFLLYDQKNNPEFVKPNNEEQLAKIKKDAKVLSLITVDEILTTLAMLNKDKNDAVMQFYFRVNNEIHNL
jgi:hypothetical protein